MVSLSGARLPTAGTHLYVAAGGEGVVSIETRHFRSRLRTAKTDECALPSAQERWHRACFANRSMRRIELDNLINSLIESMKLELPDVMEGEVDGKAGVPSYRRIDCDGRALTYLRARPRMKCIRVDITGLWRAPVEGPLAEPMAAGSTSLVVRGPHDFPEVLRYLRKVIDRTRIDIASRALATHDRPSDER